mgnify:CR=1 FL=1
MFCNRTLSMGIVRSFQLQLFSDKFNIYQVVDRIESFGTDFGVLRTGKFMTKTSLWCIMIEFLILEVKIGDLVRFGGSVNN